MVELSKLGWITLVTLAVAVLVHAGLALINVGFNTSNPGGSPIQPSLTLNLSGQAVASAGIFLAVVLGYRRHPPGLLPSVAVILLAVGTVSLFVASLLYA